MLDTPKPHSYSVEKWVKVDQSGSLTLGEQSVFRGVATFNLDAKGRMAIPAKFRKHLDACCEGRLVVTIDHADHCLQMYPLSEWEQVEQKLASLPSLNPQVRRLKRMLLGYATECEMDKNGRILLPAKLREFAGLEKSTVMIGQGNKFELWDEDTWNSLMDECLEEDFDGILPAELESLSL